MPRMRPQVRDDLVVIDYGDELVVGKVGGEISDVHYLNPTATTVFRLCDGAGTMDDVAAEIAEAYELPLEAVLRDVRTLIRQFRQRGLLTAKPVERRRRDPDPETSDNGHEHAHDHAHAHDHDHEHEHEHEHSSNGSSGEDEREQIEEQEPGHD
jgi:hypothetical protein